MYNGLIGCLIEDERRGEVSRKVVVGEIHKRERRRSHRDKPVDQGFRVSSRGRDIDDAPVDRQPRALR